MRKIIFRILGVICLLLLILQVSATPTESLVPVFVAVLSTAGAFVSFAISEVTIVEDDDDDDDRN